MNRGLTWCLLDRQEGTFCDRVRQVNESQPGSCLLDRQEETFGDRARRVNESSLAQCLRSTRTTYDAVPEPGADQLTATT